jgi:glycosyltransferase involved in cell wall biosynthesis
MKVLQIHNHYQHKTGGEFLVAEMDKVLLEANGHQVVRYIRDNDEIQNFGIVKKIGMPFGAIWSSRSHRNIKSVLKREKPDIVHVHNFFPLISPSLFHAVNEFYIPTVWTLHNYRLICAEGQFLRNQKVCQECLNKSRWKGAIHACYRGSHAAGGLIVVMNQIHKWLGTWDNAVCFYFALTEFGKGIFVKAGLKPEKIVIKPNVIYPEPLERQESEIDDYALFLGQISAKKGVEMLVDVWQSIGCKLILAGGGPLLDPLKAKALKENSDVMFLGSVEHSKAIELLRRARFLLLPSLHNEGFPLVISEALAVGVPVIASRISPLPELIEDGRTGLLFESGNGEDLRAKICEAMSDRRKMIDMGHAGRKVYDARYNVRENYRILIDTYEMAIKIKSRDRAIQDNNAALKETSGES